MSPNAAPVLAFGPSRFDVGQLLDRQITATRATVEHHESEAVFYALTSDDEAYRTHALAYLAASVELSRLVSRQFGLWSLPRL